MSSPEAGGLIGTTAASVRRQVSKRRFRFIGYPSESFDIRVIGRSKSRQGVGSRDVSEFAESKRRPIPNLGLGIFEELRDRADALNAANFC